MGRSFWITRAGPWKRDPGGIRVREDDVTNEAGVGASSFQMEEGAANQGMWTATRSWRSQEVDLPWSLF